MITMGPSDIMAKVYLWAHPVMSTIYAQWADVGFAEIFGKLSHRFYRPLRQRVRHGLAGVLQLSLLGFCTLLYVTFEYSHIAAVGRLSVDVDEGRLASRNSNDLKLVFFAERLTPTRF